MIRKRSAVGALVALAAFSGTAFAAVPSKESVAAFAHRAENDRAVWVGPQGDWGYLSPPYRLNFSPKRCTLDPNPHETGYEGWVCLGQATSGGNSSGHIRYYYMYGGFFGRKFDSDAGSASYEAGEKDGVTTIVSPEPYEVPWPGANYRRYPVAKHVKRQVFSALIGRAYLRSRQSPTSFSCRSRTPKTKRVWSCIWRERKGRASATALFNKRTGRISMRDFRYKAAPFNEADIPDLYVPVTPSTPV